MEYENTVLNKVGIINSILNSLDIPTLFNNNSFEIDYSFHYAHYLKFNFKKKGAINISLIIIDNMLQFDIDRINEAFQWSNYQLENDINNIIENIKILISSKIIVKYCGSNYTKLYFINKKGECIKKIKYIKGLFLKLNCKTKEYPPILEFLI